MTGPAVCPVSAKAPAILAPWLDVLCIGGASLLLLGPLLLSGRRDLVFVSEGAQAWVATLVNLPHFLASYRIVYRSRETMRRYRWASLYVPGVLLAYACLAVWLARYHTAWLAPLNAGAGVYLAWHYTGQAWGMMATHAYLAGRPFSESERGLIRGGLRILLIWHVTWFFHGNAAMELWRWVMTPIYDFMLKATLLALGFGAWGLVRYWQRTDRRPPLRVLVPWAAIFVWYTAMARDRSALFWAQTAHALQYLIFPVRVEMNQTERTRHPTREGMLAHMLAYGGVLLLLGAAYQQVIMPYSAAWLGPLLGEPSAAAVPIALNAFLNIHHYFTDGCVWRISNPAVRADLFAHVRAGSKISA